MRILSRTPPGWIPSKRESRPLCDACADGIMQEPLLNCIGCCLNKPAELTSKTADVHRTVHWRLPTKIIARAQLKSRLPSGQGLDESAFLDHYANGAIAVHPL